MLLKGSGGCREAAVGGDAHGAGDRSPEGQAELSGGEGEGAGGLKGWSTWEIQSHELNWAGC